MKKLVLMFVAIAAISFASCCDKTKPAPNADSTANDSAMNDSTVKDSTMNDSTANMADSAKTVK